MRTLLRPRWIVGHLLVLGLTILFSLLGVWQLQRLDQRLERNAVVEARLAQPVAPYDELAAEGADPEALAWRRALVRGRYDPDGEVLIRTRSYRGQPGWHLLTPLLLDDDPGERALLVERGWVPYELDTPPVAEAAPPAGEVTVTGLLLPEEDPPTGPLVARDPAEGELDAVFYVDTDRLQTQLPYPLEPVYLRVVAPPGADTPPALPYPSAPPELGRGPHLAYALQWFSFALIAVVGYALLLRTVVRGENADEG